MENSMLKLFTVHAILLNYFKILSVYILMSFDFPFGRLFGVQ